MSNGGADKSVKGEQFAFPGIISVPTQGDTPEEDDYVELCVVSPVDATALCGRLEREGMPCLARAAGKKDDASTEDGQVTVLVLREFVATAQKLIHDSDPASDADYDPRDEDWYVERWQCPSCKGGEIHAAPVPRRFKLVGWAGLAILILSLAERPLGLEEVFECLPPWSQITAMVLGVTMCVVFISVLGNKHCSKCGWTLHGRRGRAE